MKKTIVFIITLLLIGIGFYFIVDIISDKKKSEEVPTKLTSTSKEVIDYSKYVGTYYDTFSERAYMYIKENDKKDGLLITITWSSSAFEYSKWTMEASLNDEKLVYNDMKEYVIRTDDDGAETTNEVETKSSGYFTYDNGVIKWEGAPDDYKKECNFVKEEV